MVWYGMVNHGDMATMTWMGSHRGHGYMPWGEGEMGIDGNAHSKYAWTLSHDCMGLGGWGCIGATCADNTGPN